MMGEGGDSDKNLFHISFVSDDRLINCVWR